VAIHWKARGIVSCEKKGGNEMNVVPSIKGVMGKGVMISLQNNKKLWGGKENYIDYQKSH